MAVITSDRYAILPMVIKSPGAQVPDVFIVHHRRLDGLRQLFNTASIL
ncbi:MAG: hypothetical protein LBE74_06575 [Treponema sp.]|jgi:hypothetical protein|nr:hypothetical protein [Treponema sp.]